MKHKTVQRTRIRKQRQVLFMGGLVLICILLVLICIYFGISNYVNKPAKNRILTGVSVGETNVSGMTKEEAKKAVQDTVAEYSKHTMQFRVEKENATSSLEELGFAIKDPEKLIEEALAYGKHGNLWKRFREQRAVKKVQKVVSPVYIIDKKRVSNILEERCAPLEVPASNATISKESGEFVVTKEKEGLALDMENSVKAIEGVFSKGWYDKPLSVAVVSTVDKPQITEEMLGTIKDIIGTFTTNSGTGGGGRIQNIETGARLINGTVIMPGEEYSANGAMEPYTVENGFTEAGSYENGAVVQSMGGGICQISTTFYNAVLFAELEVTQRQPHSMLVNYVEPSKDAAIAGDYKDLKFRNNQETPIYIESYVLEGKLTFSIYGKEIRDPGRSLNFISETLNTKTAEKKYVSTNASIGSIQQSGGGYVGKDAQLWKVVLQDGAEVNRDVINKSTYMASPITVSIGTKSSSSEASAIVNTAIGTQDKEQIDAAIARAKEIEAASVAPEE